MYLPVALAEPSHDAGPNLSPIAPHRVPLASRRIFLTCGPGQDRTQRYRIVIQLVLLLRAKSDLRNSILPAVPYFEKNLEEDSTVNGFPACHLGFAGRQAIFLAVT